MSDFDDYAISFLRALYKETEETGRELQTVRDIHEKYGLSPKPHWISRMADDWEHRYFKDVSRVLGGYDGWCFQISADGAKKVESELEADAIAEAVFGKKWEREIPSSDFQDTKDTASGPIDSTKWTGARYVLTDEKVLRDIRVQVSVLRDRVYAIRFESNTDSQDLKSLCDALVSVCEMAEPELGIIERILAHPKFRYSAALIAAVGTIRGALGI